MNFIALADAATQPATGPTNWPDTIGHWFITAVVGVAGYLIAWVLATRKSIKEIAKVQAEVDKLKLEVISEASKILKDVQAARKAYIDACTELTSKLTEFIEQVSATNVVASRVQAVRDEVCAIFADKVLYRFHESVEWNHLAKTGKPDDLREFIEYHVIPQLQQFGDWLKVFNARNLLDLLQAGPLFLSIGTVQPFLDCTDGLSAKDLPLYRARIAELILRLRDPNSNK